MDWMRLRIMYKKTKVKDEKEKKYVSNLRKIDGITNMWSMMIDVFFLLFDAHNHSNFFYWPRNMSTYSVFEQCSIHFRLITIQRIIRYNQSILFIYLFFHFVHHLSKGQSYVIIDLYAFTVFDQFDRIY